MYYERKRPDYTDVSIVKKGTPRYQVAAALGKPVETYTKDGKDIDVFQVDPNGRHSGTRAAVDTFNVAADVLTICMWEVVATPAELLTKHKLTTYAVTYGPDQTVESIETVDGLPKVVSASGSLANTTSLASPSATSTPATAATQMGAPQESTTAASSPSPAQSPLASPSSMSTPSTTEIPSNPAAMIASPAAT